MGKADIILGQILHIFVWVLVWLSRLYPPHRRSPLSFFDYPKGGISTSLLEYRQSARLREFFPIPAVVLRRSLRISWDCSLTNTAGLRMWFSSTFSKGWKNKASSEKWEQVEDYFLSRESRFINKTKCTRI